MSAGGMRIGPQVADANLAKPFSRSQLLAMLRGD
jgi:hypothetical protein